MAIGVETARGRCGSGSVDDRGAFEGKGCYGIKTWNFGLPISKTLLIIDITYLDVSEQDARTADHDLLPFLDLDVQTFEPKLLAALLEGIIRCHPDNKKIYNVVATPVTMPLKKLSLEYVILVVKRVSSGHP